MVYLGYRFRLITIVVCFCILQNCVSTRSSRLAEIASEDFIYEYRQSLQKHTPEPTGSIFGNSGSIFISGDNRASKVGDILTVVLTEQDTISSVTSNTVTRSGKHDINVSQPVANMFGSIVDSDVLQDNEIGTDHSYNGSGSESKTSNVKGSVSVAIADVLPNGHYYIRGVKKVQTNAGEDYIRITGVIRPSDIRVDNTVQSTRIANADIAFIGGGDIEDASRQGWLGRILMAVDPI